MRLTAGGSLGIGTASPAGRLHTAGGNIIMGPASASTAAEFQLREGSTNGTEYVGLKAPDSIATSLTFTLPSADGTVGQVLQTNGSKVLSWTANSASGMANPMTVTGDLIYASTTASPSTPSRLAIGTAGQCLIVSGGLPIWGSCTGTAAAAGADTQIQFNNTGAFGAAAAFTWNNTNQTLSIAGTNTGAKVSLSLLNSSTGSSASNELRIGNDIASDTFTLSVNGGQYTGAGNNASIFNRQNASLVFGTNNSERMRIDNVGNLGIGTSTQFGSGSGVFSLGNALVNPTTILTNAVLLYASGGELYAYDSLGNSTIISPHDPETGLWYYDSHNTKTGRTLTVEMELLTKKLDSILGGGYVFENGEAVLSGENIIDTLTLKSNINETSLTTLKLSVDEALTKATDHLNTIEERLATLESARNPARRDSDADGTKLGEQTQTEQATPETKPTNEETGSALLTLEDSVKTIQDRLLVLETSNQTLLDFYTNLNLGNIPVVLNGTLDLGGVVVTVKDLKAKGRVEAETGSVKNLETETVKTDAITVNNTDPDAKTLGTATIPAGETSVTVKTKAVGEGSKIFVSVSGAKKFVPTFISEKNSGEGFKVDVSEVQDTDVSFDWWILEETAELP